MREVLRTAAVACLIYAALVGTYFVTVEVTRAIYHHTRAGGPPTFVPVKARAERWVRQQGGEHA